MRKLSGRIEILYILAVVVIIRLYVFVKTFLSVKLKIENFVVFKVYLNKPDH